jgi:hypothetical protein
LPLSRFCCSLCLLTLVIGSTGTRGILIITGMRRVRDTATCTDGAFVERAVLVAATVRTIVVGEAEIAGFDNGTAQSGIFSQAKQLGSILRGGGPPVPQAGVVGDLYIDTVTFNLYTKRSTEAGGDVDPWGHFLFVVPVTYQAQLKWFGTFPPTNDIGVNGDYYLLWAAFGNYGLNPISIFGPKAAGVWPSVAAAVAVTLNALYTAEDSHAI